MKAILVVCVVISLFAPISGANVFTGIYSEDMSDGGNWNYGGGYTPGNTVYLESTYTSVPGRAATLYGGTFDMTTAYVGYVSAGAFNLNVNGGTLNVGSLNAGTYGNGVVNVNGGTLNSNGYGYVGAYAGGQGTINVNSGGTFNASSSGYFYVGNAGNGTVNVNGGTASFNNYLFMGIYSGIQSTLNVNAGSAILNGQLQGGQNGATAYINVNGGSLTSNSGGLYLGYVGGGHGYMHVTGGSVDVISSILAVGGYGDGHLLMDGGTVNATTYVGLVAPGDVVMNAGLLKGTLVIGGDGYAAGQFHLDGGTVDMTAGSFAIGSLGTMDITGAGRLLLPGQVTSLARVSGNGVLGDLNFAYDSGTGITTVTAIPEPVSMTLFGLAGLIALRKKN